MQLDDSLKYFFNANYCENNTSSPLLVAYSLRDKDLIRTLLNFGADPSLKDLKSNKCLMDFVLDESDLSMIQLVSDCFMQSIVQSNLTTVRQFLSAGFDLNITESHCTLPDNNSYLHWAVMYSSEPIVRLLLENGAKINSLNK